MAHHKRKRPKNQRAGCLMCKPWKMNGFGKSRTDAESFSDHRRLESARANTSREEARTRAWDWLVGWRCLRLTSCRRARAA